MIWSASSVIQFSVEGMDGPLGTVADFLFEDAHWTVRWLVVETESLGSNWKVIVPTNLLGNPIAARQSIVAELTRSQIEASPTIGNDQSPSRKTETGVFKTYGLNPYWSGAGYLSGYHAQWGSTPFPVAGDEERNREAVDKEHDKYNPSLRSLQLVTGYHVESRDGDIGHVEDFLVDEADWKIRFIVVDTRNWWAGKRVLVPVKSVLEIDWQAKMVTLKLDRQLVKDSPAYDASIKLDEAFVQSAQAHYDR